MEKIIKPTEKFENYRRFIERVLDKKRKRESYEEYLVFQTNYLLDSLVEIQNSIDALNVVQFTENIRKIHHCSKVFNDTREKNNLLRVFDYSSSTRKALMKYYEMAEYADSWLRQILDSEQTSFFFPSTFKHSEN